jgi:predicted MFS family arabinose efflux permease
VVSLTERQIDFARPLLFRPFSNRDFTLLWLAEGVSTFGGQFYTVALPFLLSSSSQSTLGTTLTYALLLNALPRLLLMPLGGALADRFSPRLALLTGNLARAALFICLAFTFNRGPYREIILYLFSFGLGAVDALALPSGRAFIPRLVEGEALEAGNGWIEALRTLVLIIAPTIAGLLLYMFTGVGGGDGRELTTPFLLIAGVHLLAGAILWFVRKGKKRDDPAANLGQLPLEMVQGLASVLRDPLLRVIFLLLVAINLFVYGPVTQGIVVLAIEGLDVSAGEIGAVFAAYAIGGLIGALLAIAWPPSRIGVGLLGAIALAGLLIALIPLSDSINQMSLISAGIGLLTLYASVILFAWAQRLAEAPRMGRVMGVMLLASVGLSPLSGILMGAISVENLGAIFMGAGVGLIGATLLAYTTREIREKEDTGVK